MGATDSVFWWYPSEHGTLEEVDLGERVSSIDVNDAFAVADALDGVGSRYRNVLYGLPTVTISNERFTDSSVRRKLSAMINHLKRGGSVGFAFDKSKAYMAYMGSRYGIRGRTLFYGGGNLVRAWNSSAALVSGDEVVIEQANPHMLREENTFVSVTSDDITLGAGYTFNYDESPFLRYRFFWPVLRLPDDQVDKQLITHESEICHTLLMTLEYDLSGVAAYLEQSHVSGTLELGTTTLAAAASGQGTTGLRTLAALKARRGTVATARKQGWEK